MRECGQTCWTLSGHQVLFDVSHSPLVSFAVNMETAVQAETSERLYTGEWLKPPKPRVTHRTFCKELLTNTTTNRAALFRMYCHFVWYKLDRRFRGAYWLHLQGRRESRIECIHCHRWERPTVGQVGQRCNGVKILEYNKISSSPAAQHTCTATRPFLYEVLRCLSSIRNLAVPKYCISSYSTPINSGKELFG